MFDCIFPLFCLPQSSLMFGWIVQLSFQQLCSQTSATTPGDSGGQLWRKSNSTNESCFQTKIHPKAQIQFN